MAAKYAPIPEPTTDPQSLRDSVLGLKQAFEILSGQRGDGSSAAALPAEVTAAAAVAAASTTAAAATAAAATAATDATVAALTATVAAIPATVAVKSDITRSINAQTGTTYTFVIADDGKLCEFTNAAATTVTIPPNSSVAFPIGTQIDVVQGGAGKVTFAGAVGVTLKSTSSYKALSAQEAGGTLVKHATDTWRLVGSLVA